MVKPYGTWTSPTVGTTSKKEELLEFALTSGGYESTVKLLLGLLRFEPLLGLLFGQVRRCTGFVRGC